MKKQNTLFLILITITLGVGGLIYFLIRDQEIWTNDAHIEAFRVDLSSDVTREVSALFVDEGAFVKKGALIANLENDIPLAEKEAAQARIYTLEEKVRLEKAHMEKLEEDLLRAKQGIKNCVISDQEYDHAQKNFEMAEAQFGLAKANLDLAKKELKVAEAKLLHYTVRAPQDGWIAKRWVWKGDVVTPGQSLFTMYDLKNIWVTANLEEKKIGKVQCHDLVKIKIDAYPGYTFTGRVFTIKGATASQFSLIPPNNATGNYTKVSQRIPIKIAITPPANLSKEKEFHLFPGMSAEVTICPR